MKKFKCQRCGACCKMAGAKVKMSPEYAEIFDCRDDGSCGHLHKDDDGSYYCDIYESRPEICRTDHGATLGLFGLNEVGYYFMAPFWCRMLRDLVKERDHAVHSHKQI